MPDSLLRRILRGAFIATVAGLLGASSIALVRDLTHKRQKPRVLGEKIVKTPTASPPILDPIQSFPATPEPSASPSALPSSKPSAAPTTSASTTCRNSVNPSCGRFYWSPSPGSNAGFIVEIEWSPINPQVGDDVTFTLKAVDPDAKVTHHFENYGDGPASPTHADCSVSRYGAWTPPKRDRGSFSQVFHHAYNKAGSFTARFYLQSGSCGNPYGSLGRIDVPLKVAAEPTPEPEPSPTPTASP